MKKLLARKSILLAAAAIIILLIAGFWIFGGNGNGNEGFLTVKRGDFVKEISVSGKVVAAQSVDLSFSETGRVARLNVDVGDRAVQGQVLASLPTGTLASELLAAESTLAQTRAESANSQTNLEKITEEQDTLVENAYQKLLSENLTAVPASASITASAPTITGRYSGPEGRYKVVVRSSPQIGDNKQILVFDLETVGAVDIEEDEPSPLGTRGLFISFPDEISEYANTVWYITLPNTRSSTYLANYNAYQEALRTRDKEIASAAEKFSQNNSGLTVSEAEIRNAEAEVSRIKANIAERTIFAPFNGIITKVDAKLGGIASANTPAISMISAETLQVESFVPEIHVPFVKIGDEAVVTLDAYGLDVPFPARVVFLDPAETVRDGVSTYRAKLEFVEKDERIKSGMTANVEITTERKTNVIVVPLGAVTTRDGQKFVSVKKPNENSIEERPVTVGNISSYGEIEIVSGLEDGETIALPSAE